MLQKLNNKTNSIEEPKDTPLISSYFQNVFS